MIDSYKVLTLEIDLNSKNNRNLVPEDLENHAYAQHFDHYFDYDKLNSNKWVPINTRK